MQTKKVPATDISVQSSPAVTTEASLTEASLTNLRSALRCSDDDDCTIGAIPTPKSTHKQDLPEDLPQKKAKFLRRPIVMRPFESFLATELTVQNLRRILEGQAKDV